MFCDFCRYIEIVEVGREVIEKSFQNQWKDMEDCIQYLVAKRERVDYLITRNKKDFLGADIPILSPSDFLAMIL